MIVGPLAVALGMSHGIRFEYDRATETFALAPEMRAEADQLMADGTLACLSEARALHARGDAEAVTAAHRLQTLVHYRGIELGLESLCIAAANVCADAHGRSPIKPRREPS